MPAASGPLIDTDVLVDYLRGEPRALAYLDGARGSFRVSCLTLTELYAGVRDGAERDALPVIASRRGPSSKSAHPI